MGIGSGGDGGSRGCGKEWGRGLTVRNHILEYTDSGWGPGSGKGLLFVAFYLEFQLAVEA